jgi:FixJ family two-component response regulator
MNAAPVVHLVDDEPALRKALGRLLQAEGFVVRPHAGAAEFLAAFDPAEPACLVLDVAMPGMDGLELQARLARDGLLLPVVFLTAHGDIPMSVRAIRAGAVDFLTKPVDDTALLRAVRAASGQAAVSAAARLEAAAWRAKLRSLTPREHEVMAGVIAGRLNKQIAAELGVQEQTIKVHRGRVMEKMGVASLAELVRSAERWGLHFS